MKPLSAIVSAFNTSMIECDEQYAAPAFDFPHATLQIRKIVGGGQILLISVRRMPPASQRLKQLASKQFRTHNHFPSLPAHAGVLTPMSLDFDWTPLLCDWATGARGYICNAIA
jgi:hypothetical protein